MLYKEWRTVRLKLLLWIIVYAIAIVIFLIAHANLIEFDPLFQSWLGIAWLVMIVVATLGGIDLIAEEKAAGTLSFIMTRPISRTHIYTSKIGLNIAALAVTSIPASLIILLIDQLNSTPIIVTATSICKGCDVRREVGTVYLPMADLLQSLAAIGLILLFGIGIICLSSLISIVATSTMRAIFFAILVMPAFVVFTASLVAFVSPYSTNNPFWISSVNLATSLILLAIAGGLFYAGLLTFKRKEF